jgi:uncharacterized protein with GYD domain
MGRLRRSVFQGHVCQSGADAFREYNMVAIIEAADNANVSVLALAAGHANLPSSTLPLAGLPCRTPQ